MNESQALAAFSALSDATRLAVLRTLVRAGPKGLAAGVIATQTGASPSRASFHLSALAEAELVTKERKSRSIFYRIEFEQIGALVQFLLEDCCRGSETTRTCCRSSGVSGR